MISGPVDPGCQPDRDSRKPKLALYPGHRLQPCLLRAARAQDLSQRLSGGAYGLPEHAGMVIDPSGEFGWKRAKP